jgi:acetoin utilization protein AcuB
MKLNTPVADMMTKNVVSVTPSQKLNDVKHLFSEGKFHYNLPVIENDTLKGMVVLTDFMFAIKGAAENPARVDFSGLSIKDIMRETVKVVPPSTTVGEVARLFSDGEQHTVMVSEQGRLLGIVSSADIIRWLINAQG